MTASRRAVGQMRWLVGAVAAALVALVLLAGTIGRDFLPYLDEGSIWLQVQMPPGITLDKARDMADELRRATLEFPEVSYRDPDRTQRRRHRLLDALAHRGQRGPASLRPMEVGPEQAAADCQDGRALRELPGYTVGFMQPMIDGVQDKLSGAHSDLTVKVYGQDLSEDRRVADEMVGILSKVPGAADVAVDIEPPLPNLRIDLDRAAAARYGINAADVAQLISTGVGGASIGQLYVGERSYDMTVRFAPGTRRPRSHRRAASGRCQWRPGAAGRCGAHQHHGGTERDRARGRRAPHSGQAQCARP
jgi:cobalt-zinc-cadmium resistance protein CzcA